MLEARNVGVRLSGRHLLQDVDLTVRAGETVCILGENGAGKTTLLRALAGDQQARGAKLAGEVTMAGRPIEAWSLPERARLRAVLPQRPEVGFAFTAREVAAMGRYASRGGWIAAEDRTIGDKALRLTDAMHLADREVATLSGGEQARVHLATAFAQLWDLEFETTRFLLLDEPTAALDLAHQHEVLATAREFCRARGIGIVAILHDLNLAALYSDRVMILQRGAVLALGPPGDILQPATIAAGFGVAARVLPHPLMDGPLIATAVARNGEPRSLP